MEWGVRGEEFGEGDDRDRDEDGDGGDGRRREVGKVSEVADVGVGGGSGEDGGGEDGGGGGHRLIRRRVWRTLNRGSTARICLYRTYMINSIHSIPHKFMTSPV